MMAIAAPLVPKALGARRRRLLGGMSALLASAVLAGCDRKISAIVTPAAPARIAEPAPLAPAPAPDRPGHAVGVTFGRTVMLEGVTVEKDAVTPGEYLRIWLHWQSVAPAQEDLRSIGRLVTGAGRIVASEDDQIGHRRRQISRWQTGERCVDEMRLRVTASTPPGEYGLAVGVLRPDNQTAVPLSTRVSASALWQEDAIVVTTIEVTSG